MTQITLQRIFDAAWQAFIVERKPPAWDQRTGYSVYLTADGRKCPIGLALPEDHPAIRSSAIFSTIVYRFPGLFDDQINAMSRNALNDFQGALHDDHIDHFSGVWIGTPEQMKDAYLGIARQYGLIIPDGYDQNPDAG